MIMHYLFLISLGWFLREFEPIRIAATYLYDKTGRKPIVEYIFGALECWTCLTFWSALAVTLSFKEAVIASFIVFSIETVYDTWSSKR
jgi:hypothetical protein